MIDGLTDHICQLACHALIGDRSNAAVEFKAQDRLIHTILDGDIELQKELLKVRHDKGVSHLLEIYHAYYDVKSGVTMICADKTISAVKKSNPHQKPPQKLLHTVQYSTKCFPQNSV